MNGSLAYVQFEEGKDGIIENDEDGCDSAGRRSISMGKCRSNVEFAKKYNMQERFHTLVWYNQVGE